MKRLTHTQYETLISYEHGNPSWRPYAPGRSLLSNGWLMVQPRTGGDFYILTDTGRAALMAYRDRYGLRAPA